MKSMGQILVTQDNFKDCGVKVIQIIIEINGKYWQYQWNVLPFIQKAVIFLGMGGLLLPGRRLFILTQFPIWGSTQKSSWGI